MRLRPIDRQRVMACFQQVFQGEVSLWAYGSRVKNTSHEASDLDLVLVPKQSLSLTGQKVSEFQRLLQESSIPFLVQVQDWNNIPESFRKQILSEKVIMA